MNEIYKILICLFLFSQGLSAQTFNLRTHLGHLNAVFTSVYPTDSVFYVTGIITEANNSNRTSSFLAKFDSVGTLLSQKILHSDNRRIFETWIPTLSATSDGNFALAGYGYDSVGMQGLLIKYNPQGDTIWTRFYSNPFDAGDFMRVDDMKTTPDNGFIITSNSYLRVNSHGDISVIKTDSLGQVEWHRTYGDPVWNDLEPYVYVDSDSVYMVSWCKNNNNLGGQPLQNRQSRIIWLDTLGNQLHSFSSDTSNATLIAPGCSIIKTNTEEYYIGTAFGTRSSTSVGVFPNAYLYKLDNNKNWLWGKIIANHQTGGIVSIVKELFFASDSNLIAIGSRPDPNLTHEIGFMMKLSPEGDSLWQRNYAYLTGQADWNEVYDARRCPDGGYIICGESREYYATTQRQQGWLLKLDSMGCLVPGCHLSAVESIAGAAKKIAIKIFPNPVQVGEYLNFYIGPFVGGDFVGTRLIASPQLRAHLYNLEGKLIQNHTLPSDDATYMLSTEGLTVGTYILQILDAEGRILGTEKIVIR